MDDRRFDSLAKSLASGASRRSVLKGILGLGGAALAGGMLMDGEAEAARRGPKSPKPPTCPGQQSWNDTRCVCPDGLSQCNPNGGPDCCNSGVTPGSPGYSECCDNACCQGTCYGEELCCPTNYGPGEQPPTHQVCDGPNGKECCPSDYDCCLIDGCCETICYGGSVGASYCCARDNFCPGGDESEDVCCTGGTTCCGAGTNANACVDLGSENACCTDGDCDGCQHCDESTCVDGCRDGNACCGTVGCCPELQCNDAADICCSEGSFACGTTEGNQCCDSQTEQCCEGVCVELSEDCPSTCEPNCDCADPSNDGLGCNGGLDAGGGVCACGYCAVPLEGCPCGCEGDSECVRCAGNGVCETYNQGGSCNDGAGLCDGEWCNPPATCSIDQDCSSNNCCNGTCIAANACCDADDCLLEVDACVVAGINICLCIDGICQPQVTPECSVASDCTGDDECVDCQDGSCVTVNQAGSCNGGAGICDGVYCVNPPSDGCSPGCDGADECVDCINAECVAINQGGSCNGGAGVCSDVWCVECVTNDQCGSGEVCCSNVCYAGNCCFGDECLTVAAGLCAGIGGINLCICTEAHVCLPL